MRIVFILNGHDETLKRWLGYLCTAINNIGIESKFVDLGRGGKEIECEDADVVIVYRCFDYRTLRLMQRMKKKGKVLVFFLDDYLFQKDGLYTGNWKCPLTTIQEADILMSSNELLLSKMSFDRPKILRRTVLGKEAMEVLKQDYRRNNSVFSIGWISGRGRGQYMDSFINDVLGCLDRDLKDGESLCLHYFGMRRFGKYSRVKLQGHMFFEADDWRGLYGKFKDLDLGVVINPLGEDNEFHHCKSELKFVESGAMGVPLITSRVFPFTEIIKDGENGFFASSPQEFADKILILKRDENLSRRVSAMAYGQIVNDYDDIENARKFIKDLMEKIK